MIRFGDVYIAENQIAAVYPSKTEEEKVWVALKCGRSIYCSVEMLEAERALISAGMILLGEVEPCDAEEILLQDLKAEGYRYLARDADGSLYAFQMLPGRDETCWNVAHGASFRVTEPFFKASVQWSDSEPSTISELLDDAQYSRVIGRNA